MALVLLATMSYLKDTYVGHVVTDFTRSQVEALPTNIFWLWGWVVTLLPVFVALFVIRFISKFFEKEYRDIPTLKSIPVPDIKGGKVTAPVKMDAPQICCYDPSTMEILGNIKVYSKEDVAKTVQRASEAQKVWAKTSFAERRRVLRVIQQFVVQEQDTINEISVRETGKTRMEATFGEVLTTCEKIKYILANGERILSREYRAPGMMLHKTAYIDYIPYGVIGVIIPWNFPIHNAISHITTAIFTGNAAVVKVSEWASWSTKYLEDMFKEILTATGHSTDLVQFVTGYGETGSALVANVNKVLFIGSPGVGKKVMETASHTLTPVTLELGGKDPFIVLDDANLEYTIGIGTRAAFFNCGQNCMSAERFYVHNGIYDRFIKKAVEVTTSMKQGVAGPDIGAINMPLQFNRYQEYIEDAVRKGAKILVGGKVNTSVDGHFFEPTILVDVTHEMKIMKEEMFGPVMCVMRFNTDEEVIKLANDALYGLSSSVFSANYKRAHAIADKLQSGGTVVNDWGLAYMCTDLPFGGVKVSGFGKFNGPEGLRDFCSQRTCVTDRFGIVIPPPKVVLEYPTRPKAYRLAQDAIKILYTMSPIGKAKAVVSIARRILFKDY
eukprot:TRINITY_DN289_c0_g2_i1.p1 TRINITY_DN289_c0_g2~~TRINITY_DN289_c0_g2_i1.p1  ORF type:complete len:611 (-),score=188.36 TRINITY_DN289_c0_g2_i1:51-1883(-)